MISLVKNLKCISRLNIHCYPNCWYKSYITSLKAVIVGKTFISQDWILIEFCIYRQHWFRKFYRHILSKYRQKVCVCVCVWERGWGGRGVLLLETSKLASDLIQRVLVKAWRPFHLNETRIRKRRKL